MMTDEFVGKDVQDAAENLLPYKDGNSVLENFVHNALFVA
jgi:hypothetical protein